MSLSHNFNPRKPIAMLMKGRPDEPESHQCIGVYSHAELEEYRAKGWQPAKVFMQRVERSYRKDN